MSDFSRRRISDELNTAWLGRKAYYFHAVGSTNDELQRLAEAGAPAGTLVVANTQTAGKGRAGRRWYAPPDTALLFSLLLRPDWPALRAPWLSMIAGLAARRAVADVGGIEVALKWPNDVVAGSGAGARKLGGILLETAFEDDRVARAIVGIGLNVEMNHQQLPQGLMPPTSIQLERDAASDPVDRVELLAALLAELERWYGLADAGSSPHQAWNEQLIWRDRPVVVLRSDRATPVVQGRFHGVDQLGRLLIDDQRGVRHVVSSGDLSLRVNENPQG